MSSSRAMSKLDAEDGQHSDADVGALFAWLEIEARFAPAQAKALRWMVERIVELEHRAISLDARLVRSELGAPPLSWHRTIFDIGAVCARVWEIGIDELRDRMTIRPAAIGARQCLASLAAADGRWPNRLIMISMGERTMQDVLTLSRHAEMRMADGAFRAKFEAIRTEWLAFG